MKKRGFTGVGVAPQVDLPARRRSSKEAERDNLRSIIPRALRAQLGKVYYYYFILTSSLIHLRSQGSWV